MRRKKSHSSTLSSSENAKLKGARRNGLSQVPFHQHTTQMDTIVWKVVFLWSISPVFAYAGGLRYNKQMAALNDDEGIRPYYLFPQNQTKVPLRVSCDNVTRICGGNFTICRKSYCHCIEGYAPQLENPDLCGERVDYNTDIQTDPTMIGVVIGLILMSITLCIVMRLFAKARFRENRTIFNTPNPRLMNVSLMKGSKHFFRGNSATTASGGRRGSQTSENSQADDTPSLQQQSRIPLSEDVGGGRSKILRQQSTDTTTGGGDTPTASTSAGGGGGPPRYPIKGKYRQDSVASNSNV